MTLSETDARSLIRLLGETAMVAESISLRKQYLMKGLCKLVGADAYVWALGCQMEPQQPQVFINFIHGGFDDERFTKYLTAVEHPDMVPIASKFAESIKTRKGHTTMRRDEIDSLGLSYKGNIGDLWADADIGDLMLSAYPVDDQNVSTIGLYRSFGAAPFSEREKCITHLVLSEVYWLHLSDWPEDKGVTVPKLSPRQRVVLNLLLEGLGRKQMAAHMDIAENTVSGYVKDVYRHFDVHSHAELMKKFLYAPDTTSPQSGE